MIDGKAIWYSIYIQIMYPAYVNQFNQWLVSWWFTFLGLPEWTGFWFGEHALNSKRPTLTHLANGWICINVSLISWYIVTYIYTFSVWVISYCPMESLICKQTSLSPCATKAPSWPQMTLNVFWLEELEVRGRMLEYEDAKGRQCFFLLICSVVGLLMIMGNVSLFTKDK